MRSRAALSAMVIAGMVGFLATATGCLSPATLRPVADQNVQNVANYNDNVARLSQALVTEAQFHGRLEIKRMQDQIVLAAVALALGFDGISDPPTDAELINTGSDAYIALQNMVDEALDILEAGRDGEVSELVDVVMLEYPLAADIALQTPGFSIPSVLRDAYNIDASITDYQDPETHRAKRKVLEEKVYSICDRYISVRETHAAVNLHLQGLADYLAAVSEQSKIASSHANAISAYAQSQPRLETLGGAMADQDLQQGLLDLIQRKNGADAAERVSKYLTKANTVAGFFGGNTN